MNSNSRQRSPTFGEFTVRQFERVNTETSPVSSALKVAEVDLAAARSHVQQFRDISQANEAALANLNATHDEYQTATEAELEKRQVCLRSHSVGHTLTTRFPSV